MDAVVYDKPSLAWLVRQDHPNELQMLGLDLDPQSYAIAVPFGSPLRRKLNIALVDGRTPPGGASWSVDILGFE